MATSSLDLIHVQTHKAVLYLTGIYSISCNWRAVQDNCHSFKFPILVKQRLAVRWFKNHSLQSDTDLDYGAIAFRGSGIR